MEHGSLATIYNRPGKVDALLLISNFHGLGEDGRSFIIQLSILVGAVSRKANTN